MSWQAAVLAILALVILAGFAWFERSRPSARIVAAVAALAALGVAGRVVLAPIPNVVATTDVALLAGYTLGGGPGFAVGALSGLISNFWLGQGPWTPWQMAGWGLVGIGGALLARFAGAELNRWKLAAVAGLAGLAYGALLDLSVMVSYGGEQSLDRYLALSARGIPFNVAHALGNATLMVIAGPALIRLLDRYRDRFRVRWSDVPLRAAAAIAAALCLALPLLAPGSANAAGGADAARWLEGAQGTDGGFATEPGGSSSAGMTGWAMLGLEAAGINPLDVSRGGRTPVDYLRSVAGELDSTADLERTILALSGAGVDPRAFAGTDLVAELRSRQGSDGSYEKQVNLTAFAVLAQRAAGVDGFSFGKPTAWLRKAQNEDGGWGSTDGAESEPDSTGAVLQALTVAPGGGSELEQGVRWLKRAQRKDGGWSLTRGAASNSQSTAWAIQGLVAAGSGADSAAFGYLASRQSSDGHYAYSGGSDQTPVWVTAQAITGVERRPFPIAAVPRDAPARRGDGRDREGSGGAAGAAGERSGDDRDPRIGKRKANAAGAGGKRSGGGGGRGGSTDDVAVSEPGEAPTAIEAAQASASSSPVPATEILLGGLGALGLLLGLGYLRFRRKLS